MLLCLLLCLSAALALAEDGNALDRSLDFSLDLSFEKWNDFVYSYTNAAGNAADLQCSVYIPAAWEQDHHLPLVSFIPDSSLVGKAMNTYKRAACPTKWLSAEKMNEHPFVMLLIRFTSASSDVTEAGEESAQIVPIMDQVAERFELDTDRLYLTGQSMGGIMDFALNDAYPEKFAATVYVGCQMGGDVGDAQYLKILENAAFAGQKWIYITSRMDGKAPYGQDDVEQVLIRLGLDYGKLYGLDHEGSEALEEQVKAVLDQGYDRNLLGFTQVTGTGDPAGEHMQSFKYAYAVDAIFDWLMAQHR